MEFVASDLLTATLVALCGVGNIILISAIFAGIWNAGLRIKIKRLRGKVEKLKSANSKLSDRNDKMFIKIINQRIEIECMNELKKSFGDASKELNRLQKAELENVKIKANLDVAFDENKTLKERVKRMQETIEHKKHSKPKQEETGWWRCDDQSSYTGFFTQGNIYEVKGEQPHIEGAVRLCGNDKMCYVVKKSDFTIVPKPTVKENARNTMEKLHSNIVYSI